MDGHQWTAHFEAPGGKPVLRAYPDPLTGAEPWTIGIGHTGDDVHEGDEWTYDRCMATYYSDYAIAQASASHVIGSSCWSSLNEPRRCVLIDMALNIGGPRLAQFVHMLEAIRAGKWHAAQSELLSSKYAQQVKGRADMNGQVLLTGNWPGEALTS